MEYGDSLITVLPLSYFPREKHQKNMMNSILVHDRGKGDRGSRGATMPALLYGLSIPQQGSGPFSTELQDNEWFSFGMKVEAMPILILELHQISKVSPQYATIV